MSLERNLAITNRSWKVNLLAGAFVLILLTGCSTGTGSLQDVWKQARKIPELVDKNRLPTLDALLNREPVTSSFDHAVTEAPFLDGFPSSREAFLPLSWFPRNEDGTFLLVPGLYFMDAESYCIRAGTYGPSQGVGYLYAPIKGPRADIVQSVLRRSAKRPDIEQSEVQLLLWTIIARTRLGDMPMERRRTAVELLTPRELFELNGGALGLIPPETMQSWMAKIPPEVQKIYEAERKLRELFTTRVDARFEEIERLAVLVGVAPAAHLIRSVPQGRWSYHPRGYFIRFVPSSYSRTRLEVYVPRPFSVERDGSGRITALDDGSLLRVETTYRSGTDQPEGSTEGLLAYRFQTLRLKVRASQANPGAQDRQLEKKDKGWVFLESPVPVAEKPANLLAWPSRRQLSLDTRKNLTSSPAGETAGTASFREVLDVISYIQAIKEALTPPGTKNPRWVSAALGGISRASHSVLLSHFATRHEAGKSRRAASESRLEAPSPMSLPIVYDPTESVAMPANRSSQRLVSGGVPYGDESPLWHETLPNCPCHWDEEKWDGRRASDRRGRMGTWDEPLVDARLTRYHPGAVHELRWVPDDGMAGQQCTYDRKGRLITGGLGAGTPDLLSPTASPEYPGLNMPENFFSHSEADVLTWEKLPCANYLLMWPPNQGEGCEANTVTEVPADRAARESCAAIQQSRLP